MLSALYHTESTPPLEVSASVCIQLCLWRQHRQGCQRNTGKREHVAADRIQSGTDLHRKVHCVLLVVISGQTLMSGYSNPAL